MTNKTKYQTKVLELLDDLLTEKTLDDEKLKQNVKEYIGSKVSSIDAVLFDVDGDNIELGGIIEQVKNETLEELEELLNKYELDYYHEYLSGDYQVYIRLDGKEVVINKGSEKDFVLFIGDISFEMTSQELENFLSRNVQKDIGSILKEGKLSKVFNLLAKEGYAFDEEDNKIIIKLPGIDLEFFENKGKLYVSNLVGYVKPLEIEKEVDLHSAIFENAFATKVIKEVVKHLDSCYFNYTLNYKDNNINFIAIESKDAIVIIKVHEEINKITIQERGNHGYTVYYEKPLVYGTIEELYSLISEMLTTH
ncbi:hypothetical protein HOS99_gp115 [Staphylococcus phage phiSA_BS1]|uniref:Uncharacterized protein n=1 Tax=Staphylococcus phage phiSA_BS1 TaxID=2126734 RepID=A0A2P1MXS3_9CAUD|nr:hypothetical protein HOS99_gp115 [Staphylococcus phage phiSA_BS1]AVP40356.1 hypothetical protein [Staphylococcus phage phiSA_BS1]